MAANKHYKTSDAGPSRRDMLIHGSKVAASMGIATLLGNVGDILGHAYGMDRSAKSLLDALKPSRTALLVIDMQRDFLASDGYAAQAGLDITPLIATRFGWAGGLYFGCLIVLLSAVTWFFIARKRELEAPPAAADLSAAGA